MPASAPDPQLVSPPCATPGGRVAICGRRLFDDRVPDVTLDDVRAHVTAARHDRLVVQVPRACEGGVVRVRVGSGEHAELRLTVGRLLATGLHQVDNPAYDRQGRLYLTYSGARGQEVPVSIFRVAPGAARESYSSAVVNPTSMAIGPDGHLYVSSRFEGSVYRVADDGTATPVVTDAGVACGLAFDAAGTLFVGDRSGTILRAGEAGRLTPVATLPPSVAAFHLAMGPDGWVYVTAPTLRSADRVYRVHPDGRVDVVHSGFGRPQGLAFDAAGRLYVTEALAGASGLFRLPAGGAEELVISGDGLLGVAFGPAGTCVVCSNDSAWHFDEALLPIPAG